MPKVDVRFQLLGTQIPADHGYPLFAALSDLVPELHGDEDVGVLPVAGRLIGGRQLAITDASFLTLRIDSERIGQILPLAGKTVRIGPAQVTIGVPQTRALVPAARLYSRLVVIKGFMEPEPFLEAARRQLEAMEVRGCPMLVAQPAAAAANDHRPGGTHSPYLRRTLRIRDKEVVGFALRVEELTAEESIRLQETGLGGRRRFGCGVFLADQNRSGAR